MDFARVELLNSKLFSLTDYVSSDVNSANFDSDDDLLFSANGGVLLPSKPIDNYQWIDITVENLSGGVPIIGCYAVIDNNGAPLKTVTCGGGSVAPYSVVHYYIPYVGPIEQLIFFSNGTNKWAAVKSISVAVKTLDYKKKVSSLIVPTVPGWTFDATNNRYSKVFSSFESFIPQVTNTPTSQKDFINVKVWTTGSGPLLLSCTTKSLVQGNPFIANIFSAEFDISCNSLENALPTNISITAPLGGGTVFAEFRYGSFPAVSSSIFGGETLTVPSLSS